ILQYAIHSIPSIWQRRFLACLSWPFLMLLQRLDFPTARRLKVLKTFSTGYLVIANRLPSKRALMTAENAIVEAAS
ncbi:MAG: hypothetical protein HYU33_02250, partial [Candidatus Omnitrophica bacterium]|nr:hypothetical protein [Candidatus Omnitrophota bacterium]